MATGARVASWRRPSLGLAEAGLATTLGTTLTLENWHSSSRASRLSAGGSYDSRPHPRAPGSSSSSQSSPSWGWPPPAWPGTPVRIPSEAGSRPSHSRGLPTACSMPLMRSSMSRGNASPRAALAIPGGDQCKARGTGREQARRVHCGLVAFRMAFRERAVWEGLFAGENCLRRVNIGPEGAVGGWIRRACRSAQRATHGNSA